MSVKAAAVAALVLSAFATAAPAEVIEKDADHFVLRYSMALETTPEDIYGAIGEIDAWWNPAHTYTGDAANLTLQMQERGCFCERLTDGSLFEHGLVVWAEPASGVMLEAPLGPLKGKATRAIWGIGWSDDGPGLQLAMTYVVRGPGLGAMAEAVDGVMGDQFGRLAHFIEYGPDVPAAPAS